MEITNKRELSDIIMATYNALGYLGIDGYDLTIRKIWTEEDYHNDTVTMIKIEVNKGFKADDCLSIRYGNLKVRKITTSDINAQTL
jgi:hypothetical protein